MQHHLNYGFIIERTGKKLKQSLQKVFNNLGVHLTVDQWVVLYELHKNGDMAQNRIAQNVYKDAPTTTRILDLLAGKNLISRTNSPKDRRKYLITLTADGNDLVEMLLPHVHKYRKAGWKNLKKSDLKKLTDVLNVIFDNMEKNYD